MDGDILCPAAEENMCNNLREMKDILIKGYEVIKQQNSRTLGAYTDYGKWLYLAFEQFKIDKDAGTIESSITFKKWLEENIGINDSYERKLRDLAVMFASFPKIRQLGMSFNDLYQKRKRIPTMLMTYPDLSTFWRS